jgi:hypothetical protein
MQKFAKIFLAVTEGYTLALLISVLIAPAWIVNSFVFFCLVLLGPVLLGLTWFLLLVAKRTTDQ